jgi:hypothetical protein
MLVPQTQIHATHSYGHSSFFDILLALKARIPTEPGFGPVTSVGSSYNCPTSAEDNEEALLLGCPPIGPFWDEQVYESETDQKRLDVRLSTCRS